MKHNHHKIFSGIGTPGQPLSTKEVETIVKDDQSLAQYLATLTPRQVEDLRDAINEADMPKEVKESLIRLMDIVYKEARNNEKAYEEKVLPLATGIAIAMTLSDQIALLEAIYRSLHDSPDTP